MNSEEAKKYTVAGFFLGMLACMGAYFVSPPVDDIKIYERKNRSLIIRIDKPGKDGIYIHKDGNEYVPARGEYRKKVEHEINKIEANLEKKIF